MVISKPIPDEHLVLIKDMVHSNVKQRMIDYNKSVLDVISPEISKLLIRLTPLVLANNNLQVPTSDNTAPNRDELWLNAMSGTFKSMHVLTDDDDDLESLVNIANSIPHLIALLSSDRLLTEDKIYRVLTTSNGTMDQLDKRINLFSETLYSAVGERPQIKPVS